MRLEPDDPGQVGPYRVVDRLGRGGMGTVYLAEDSSGKRVAVKVINPELAADEAFRARFRREADAAQRVRRFCTAAVVSVDLDGELLYVATEYVEGPTLHDAAPLAGSNLDSLAVSVATALTAIHSAGVVHRDLKPSNVLLSPVGPRVIDFGIARPTQKPDEITKTEEIIGTPDYLAPELLRGEPATPACDVFAWGCLVAFAATGKAPFAGLTAAVTVDRILNGEPELDALEPDLRVVVGAALAKSPGVRPTAQELLDRLVATAPTPTRVMDVPLFPSGTAKPRRTARIVLAVFTLALVVAVAAVVASLVMPRRAEPDAEAAARLVVLSLQSYDYRTVDADQRRTRGLLVDGMADQYDATSASLRDQIISLKATSQATVVSTKVERVEDGRITVIVNTESTIKGTEGPKRGQTSLRLVMVNKQGRWLAAEAEDLG